MQKTFIFYTDPGHGWGKVPIKLLINLGIADKISTFSYTRNGFAFLEEDCDLPLFIKKLNTIGVTPKFKPQHTDRNSRIRNYPYYRKELYANET